MNKADKKSLLTVLGAVCFIALWWVIGETNFIQDIGQTGQAIISTGTLVLVSVLFYVVCLR